MKILPFNKKSTQIFININEDLKCEISKILNSRKITLSQFVSEAINLRKIWIKNASIDSRLIIENPKDMNSNFSLLVEDGRQL